MGSAWWREIVKIQNGISVEGGSWFEESITKRLGNGLNTFFWSDCWVGTKSFMERYRRLFDLSIHKDLSVGEMYVTPRFPNNVNNTYNNKHIIHQQNLTT